MSRVGQAIINIPDGVEVKKVDNEFLEYYSVDSFFFLDEDLS